MKFFRADTDYINKLTEIRIAYIKEEQGDLSAENEKIMAEKLPAYFRKHLEKDLFAFAAEENGEVIASALLLITEKPSNPDFIYCPLFQTIQLFEMPPTAAMQAEGLRGLYERLRWRLCRRPAKRGISKLQWQF